jgi:hypothetical protein
MINNFTQFKLIFSEKRLINKEFKIRRDYKLTPDGPSDSIIKNLLNFSKSLSVVTDNHTGNVHMILLN